jgi:hypothetical protein
MHKLGPRQSFQHAFLPHFVPFPLLILQCYLSSTMETHYFRLLAPQNNVTLTVARPVPRQVLSSDKWEQLRPLIGRLYLREKKTFRMISAILQENHGFSPTKSQFDKRVRQWGFKKNASQHERHMITKNHDKLSYIGPDGRVISQSTREIRDKVIERSMAPFAVHFHILSI